jgi:hypothetical protein
VTVLDLDPLERRPVVPVWRLVLGIGHALERELDVLGGQLAEAAGELDALPQREIDVALVHLLDRLRGVQLPVPAVARLGLDQVREDRVHDVALGLGEPVQGVEHLQVRIGADAQHAPVLRPHPPRRRERGGAEGAAHQQERSPVEIYKSHRFASPTASRACSGTGAPSRVCALTLARAT